MRRDIVARQLSEYVYDGNGPSPEKLIFEARARTRLQRPMRLAYWAGAALAAAGNRTYKTDRMTYRDLRVGLHGEELEVDKWQTLRPGTQHDGRSARKKNALFLGNLHRVTGLDEVPQFFQIGKIDITGAFRPERLEDRTEQLTVMREDGFGQQADVLEAGFELVTPATGSLAASYGHWRFDAREEVERRTIIVRGLLSYIYLSEGTQQLDERILRGTVAGLGRAALHQGRCEPFAMQSSRGLVGPYVARIQSEYPQLALDTVPAAPLEPALTVVV